tara:strand:+ start:4434 stop:5216 length:783 start_codon:yes stop_codon:yes gene_type:complete
MDFDPKCFFENPPRMKEDLKDYIKDLAEKIVKKISAFCKILFEGERITPKHIKSVIFAICPDPITTYNRQGLCAQKVLLKPIYKVICKSIDQATNSEDTKYGGLERKIVKACGKYFSDLKMASNTSVAVAAVISTICGIILQSAQDNVPNIKTLTLDSVKQFGTTYSGSSGQYPYCSLIRFIKIVEVFDPTPISSKPVVSKPKPVVSKPKPVVSKPQKELKPVIVYDKIENKQVHFKKDDAKSNVKRPRPSTPENCFWED